MDKKEYTLEEVKLEANSFLNRKKAINKTTYLNYRTSFNYFTYYLEEIAEVNVVNISNKEAVVEEFQGLLLNGFSYKTDSTVRSVKIKPNGVNTHIRRIKTFFNKCLGLPVEVKKLNVNRPKYKSLTPEEIKLLVTECFNYWKNEEIAIRNSTLITFLFNTAFRINEALTIKEADVFSNEGSYYVRIHEKGKAKGVLTEITISENTFNLLNKYLEVKKVPSVYLFSSTKASADGMAKNLSREVFNRYVRNLAKYVDVKHNTNIYKTVENNSSHFLRHSKATYLLNVKKEDVVTVKEILRHKSIDSTLIYLNPEEEAINKVRINNDL